jgi:prophage regulatory protein
MTREDRIKNQIAAATDDDALLIFPVVLALTGVGRSSLYKKIADKTFPAPVKLGPRMSRFRAGDVRSWIRRQASA